MPQISVRADIEAAAMEMFSRRGYHATAVKDITSAAGVPKGSFYNHFASKEDLALHTLECYWAYALEGLKMLSRPAEPAKTRLLNYFEALNSYAEKHRYKTGCMVGNLATEMSEHSEKIRAKVSQVFDVWTTSLEACIRQGQADRSITNIMDSDKLAAFLLNSWEGSVLRAKADRSGRPLNVFAEFLIQIL
ncbi:TetR/AcrR family transcriptional regulator [Pseudomonas sp. ME-P-057]|uniref:TetR/AcrR family transcriptional regulator n=1 Tax=Pseudomonas sp. ME-P-057 TaxID=3040321 RepID=UPI002557002B|nr:TetR/AcrR family transcriptional regulator [Pseudomonas sp. ME-P-057]